MTFGGTDCRYAATAGVPCPGRCPICGRENYRARTDVELALEKIRREQEELIRKIRGRLP